MATNTFYTSNVDAINDVNGRTHNYISYLCPFTHENKACGSWCPLFEIAGHTRGIDGANLTHVNLRCGDGHRVFHSIT
jgi:hypothetical protein